MSKIEPLEPKYTGEESIVFWVTIDKSLAGADHDAACAMGLMLQRLEGAALEFINRALERKQRIEL